MTDQSPQSIPINARYRQLRTSTDSPKKPGKRKGTEDPETPAGPAGGAHSQRVLRLERAWIITGLLAAPQIALLAVLCTGLNRAFHVRLSVAEMAGLAGLSLNGARRALGQLLDMRVVSRLERARGNIPAAYRINAPQARQAAGGHTEGRTQAQTQAQPSPSAQP